MQPKVLLDTETGPPNEPGQLQQPVFSAPALERAPLDQPRSLRGLPQRRCLSDAPPSALQAGGGQWGAGLAPSSFLGTQVPSIRWAPQPCLAPQSVRWGQGLSLLDEWTEREEETQLLFSARSSLARKEASWVHSALCVPSLVLLCPSCCPCQSLLHKWHGKDTVPAHCQPPANLLGSPGFLCVFLILTQGCAY